MRSSQTKCSERGSVLQRENPIATRDVRRKPGHATRARHAIRRQQREARTLGIATSAERVGTRTRHVGHGILRGLLQRVRGIVRLRDDAHPTGAGTLEHEVHGQALLMQIVGDGERVEQATERLFATLKISKDDDGGVHSWLHENSE